jgi:SSS family solute:Na+ symporter
MGSIDYAVIAAYFAIVIALGLWYQKRAAKDLDSYFLGGKRLHWLALSMSGSVSTFDITGTMWIVTLIALFGMRSMWNHWMWGFLMGAFFMAYMGKWVRRSGVMTGAEWMVTRFGDGPAGRIARGAYALMAVVTQSAFIAYAFQGIGKFASVYVDLGLGDVMNARVLAGCVFAVTTLYVILGGLFSVVVTDVIQTVVLTAAAILIAVVAYTCVTPELLAQVRQAGWGSPLPTWRLADVSHLPEAYRGYEWFGALVIVWVLKGFLLNAGGPGQMYDFQRFLAARSPRDAAKVGATWSLFLIVRWAMAMGIALLALTVAKQVTDAEKLMPTVLQVHLRPGLRGLVIAGLLAAFMSTFSSTVNSGASYIVRDLYQPLLGRKASQKHLVAAGYIATAAIVLIGTAIGLGVKSIGQIFSWIMMELGAAFVIPNVLRWYWWRLNGWGYAVGTLVGLAGAVAVPFLPAMPLYVTFPAICGLSLTGCLLGTFLARPTDMGVLASFFRRVRPFGAWGPVRAEADLPAEELTRRGEGLGVAVVNVLLASAAVLGIYLAPMYLVGHWHREAGVCALIAAACVVCLYLTWYRNLPPAREGAQASEQ